MNELANRIQLLLGESHEEIFINDVVLELFHAAVEIVELRKEVDELKKEIKNKTKESIKESPKDPRKEATPKRMEGYCT